MSEVFVPIVVVIAWILIFIFLKDEDKGPRFFSLNLISFVVVTGSLSLLAYINTNPSIAVYYRAMIMFVAVTHVVVLFFYTLIRWIDRKGF